MRITIVRLRRVTSLVGLCLTVLLVWSPKLAAAPSYSGQISGVFTNPVLTGNHILVDGTLQPLDNTNTAVHTGFGTSSITWGADPTSVAGRSSLSFTGFTFTNVVPGELFNVGQLDYFNGESLTTSLIFGATLTISSGATVFSPASTAATFLATENSGDPLKSADYITFSPIPIALHQFHVLENQSGSAIFVGRIVGDPEIEIVDIILAPGQSGGFLVPEPATILLLVIGVIALGRSSARRRNIRIGT